MGTKPVRMSEASSEAKPKPVDMKFEIVVIPVSDVDRRRTSTRSLAGGSTPTTLTMTTSACSSSRRLAPAALSSSARTSPRRPPGSSQGLYLIVSDLEATRAELLRRGVEVSEVFHNEGVYAGTDDAYLFGRVRVSGPDPEHAATARSPRSKIRMATAGCSRKLTTRLPGSHRFRGNDFRVGQRSGQRDAPQRPLTASTKSAPAANATKTGPTGTPRTWWRSSLARSYQSSAAAIESPAKIVSEYLTE